MWEVGHCIAYAIHTCRQGNGLHVTEGRGFGLHSSMQDRLAVRLAHPLAPLGGCSPLACQAVSC